ncbi:hypothetical protein DRP04_02720 [Archaeoglobales archaeon]|nr:MAG: hypothetical protein DRP04_02720 [Archaeoglobales archaeon]
MMKQNQTIKKVVKIDPLDDKDAFREIVWEYLKPEDGPAPRAHLLTINGLTYPFNRDFCFAAVPDPHEITRTNSGTLQISTPRSKRRYSMLAYLHGIRPGDLIFFFQADPQWPKDVMNRRGFRGIWIAKSMPFRDTTAIKHPDTGYEILGACPACGTPFNFGQGGLENEKKCPLCGNKYGKVMVNTVTGTKKYSRVVLSARILIEPLIVFKRTAGDNRVYSDMSIEPLVWISRTDNAMGPGKGSSIRVLLPEEATKVAYMLATEDPQSIDENLCKYDYPGKTDNPIADHNNIESRYPRVKRVGNRYVLEHEFHLNLYFALHIDDPYHSLNKLLGVDISSVDYWTNEFPWGYTGDTADFVLSLWNDVEGRHTIYLFEFKKDIVDKKSLAEVLLYIPWVVQVMTQFRHETTDIVVQPVIVGKKFNGLFALPRDYGFQLKFFTSSKSKNVTVRTPILLQYDVNGVFRVKDVYTNRDIYYAEDLDFRVIRKPTRAITPPPLSLTTTEVEKDFAVQKYLCSI